MLSFLSLVVAIIALYVSIYFSKRQTKLQRQVNVIEHEKFVADSFNEHITKFTSIQSKIFLVLNEYRLCFEVLPDEIVGSYGIFDNREQNVPHYVRPLRHIFYDVCTSINIAFEEEITWQTPEFLVREFLNTTRTLNEGASDYSLDINKFDLRARVRKMKRPIYDLHKEKIFKQLCHELYSFSNFKGKEKEEALCDIFSILTPVIEMVEAQREFFLLMQKELRAIKRKNKLEVLRLSQNQKLYWNITQLDNLLGWFIRGFPSYNKKINTENMLHSSIIEKLVYWVSLLMLLNNLQYQCENFELRRFESY